AARRVDADMREAVDPHRGRADLTKREDPALLDPALLHDVTDAVPDHDRERTAARVLQYRHLALRKQLLILRRKDDRLLLRRRRRGRVIRLPRRRRWRRLRSRQAPRQRDHDTSEPSTSHGAILLPLAIADIAEVVVPCDRIRHRSAG